MKVHTCGSMVLLSAIHNGVLVNLVMEMALLMKTVHQYIPMVIGMMHLVQMHICVTSVTLSVSIYLYFIRYDRNTVHSIYEVQRYPDVTFPFVCTLSTLRYSSEFLQSVAKQILKISLSLIFNG